MARLDGISTADLRSHLHDVDGNRPALRLVVGINYKEGIPQTTIANWYGISRTTVHNWLKRLERLEHEPLEAVVYDADRSGRPPKLSSDQMASLEAALAAPPSEFGFKSTEWTVQIVQSLISDRFNVEYSKRHIRNLLQDIELE